MGWEREKISLSFLHSKVQFTETSEWLLARKGPRWPVIDTTNGGVEETAAKAGLRVSELPFLRGLSPFVHAGIEDLAEPERCGEGYRPVCKPFNRMI